MPCDRRSHPGADRRRRKGGLDIVFPHHENERAQSTAAGHAFAQVWVHNGMVEFAGEKMSPMEYLPGTLNAAAARLDTIVELAQGVGVAAAESDAAEWDRVVDGIEPPAHVTKLLAERGQARLDKDYSRADEVARRDRRRGMERWRHTNRRHVGADPRRLPAHVGAAWTQRLRPISGKSRVTTRR